MSENQKQSSQEWQKAHDNSHKEICGNCSPIKLKCCKDCFHINFAHDTSIDYCSDNYCKCHLQKQSVEGWSERFEKKFFLDDMNSVRYTDESEIFGERDTKFLLKEFISQLLSQQQLEVVEKVKELIKSNSKGSFTDDAGNDCWYIDDLLQSLSTLTTLNNK